MAEANSGDQKNETKVEDGGALGVSSVNSSFINTTINIVQQPALRRDSSTTGPLDEDVASFLSRLSLNKLSKQLRLVLKLKKEHGYPIFPTLKVATNKILRALGPKKNTYQPYLIFLVRASKNNL